ncbi:cupin domain-containing protein [Sorangium sp. So ce291]|uniref:cupin domain-containing protein n=1 Tax=Sorangium sp. So ce291 TaxID=3133294 RepID=UPI003F5D9C46
MARWFNVAGPCKPEIHYMLPALRRVPTVRQLVDQRGSRRGRGRWYRPAMRSASILLVACCLSASACTQRAPRSAGQDAHGTTVEVLAKGGASWDGAALPAYPTTAPEVTVVRITIPPHSALPIHKHPIINASYMVSGAITVVTESGKELKVRAGDGFLELVDAWHHGRNDGDEPAVIVVVYVGSPGAPLTVEK